MQRRPHSGCVCVCVGGGGGGGGDRCMIITVVNNGQMIAGGQGCRLHHSTFFRNFVPTASKCC